MNIRSIFGRRANDVRRRGSVIDQVTGLPNHLSLARWLDEHAGQPVAVLVLDLDEFMSVNDRFGAEVGDAVLDEVAARLRSALDEDVFLARIGADEFVAVASDPDRAERVEGEMRAAMHAITTPDGVPVEACVGLVVGPARWELVHEVDRPLYAEKRAHAQRRRSRSSGGSPDR